MYTAAYLSPFKRLILHMFSAHVPVDAIITTLKSSIMTTSAATKAILHFYLLNVAYKPIQKHYIKRLNNVKQTQTTESQKRHFPPTLYTSTHTAIARALDSANVTRNRFSLILFYSCCSSVNESCMRNAELVKT